MGFPRYQADQSRKKCTFRNAHLFKHKTDVCRHQQLHSKVRNKKNSAKNSYFSNLLQLFSDPKSLRRHLKKNGNHQPKNTFVTTLIFSRHSRQLLRRYLICLPDSHRDRHRSNSCHWWSHWLCLTQNVKKLPLCRLFINWCLDSPTRPCARI